MQLIVTNNVTEPESVELMDEVMMRRREREKSRGVIGIHVGLSVCLHLHSPPRPSVPPWSSSWYLPGVLAQVPPSEFTKPQFGLRPTLETVSSPSHDLDVNDEVLLKYLANAPDQHFP